MTRPGLTALELIVGLAVTALAAGIGTATLGLLVDRRAPLLEPAGEVARAAAVRRTLVDWLEGAHGSLSPFAGSAFASFQLLDRARDGRPADELLIATSAETPLGAGETLVRLYVDADERTPERGLVAELSARPGGAAMILVLDSAVATLDARCLTGLPGGRQWLTGYLSSEAVPRGIELRLGAARGERIAPLLALPIRVALEAGR